MLQNKLIWALTDGRPGSDNQTIAVAQSLGQYENHRIDFGPTADLPNFLLGTSDLGILTKLEKPWPDLVIAAGRRLARVARMIKKDSGGKTKIIQLMWPGIGAHDFDLIFAPQHDNLKPRNNLVTTYGPPNLMTAEVLKASKEKWQPRIPINSKPAIAVLIGNITTEECTSLIQHLNILTGYLMISTSRRTAREVVETLETGIHIDHYFYKWTADNENPYLGFIALADFIIVTEDSISMASEAVTTGKPTYIFPCNTTTKHKRFTKSLTDSGRARLLDSEKLETYNYEPLNTIKEIILSSQRKLGST